MKKRNHSFITNYLTRPFIIYICSLSVFSTAIAQIPLKNDVLNQDLRDAQVVLLGEPDHFSTTEMLWKVELIKYLHDSLNYNWLAFESSIYDMHKANQDYMQGLKVRDALYAGIFSVWHGNEAIDSLESYLESLADRTTLQLTGFDSQINSGIYTKKFFCQELQSFLIDENITVPDSFIEKLQKEITAFDGEKSTLSEDFDPSFLDELKQLIYKLEPFKSSIADFWRQNLISIHGLLYDHHFNQIGLKANSGAFNSRNTNVRDSLMAENMIWFLKNHPKEKVIGWGASFHFANDLSKLSLLKDNSLSSTKPMGYYLKKALEEKVLLIGFSDLKRIENAEGQFIEDEELYNEELAIIDFKKLGDSTNHSSFIGGVNGEFPHGKWKDALDYGVAFNSEAPFKREGVIVDASDGRPIPFAHVRIAGSNAGTITNERGKFRLLLPVENKDAGVGISCVGYQPIDVKNQELDDTIRLISDIRFLEMVEITAEREQPANLLLKVAETFVENSKNEDYQVEAYYYSWWTDVKQPTDTAVNEAALKMIYKNGYTEDQKISHTILNKRLVYGKKGLVPWPIHTIGMADFRPGFGLLNSKIARYLSIDSIKYQLTKADTLTTFFYTITKPSFKLVGSTWDTYRAEITFPSKTLKVKKKSIYVSSDGNGLQEAAYHIEYEDFKGFQVPSFAWMAYKGVLEGRECVGKEAIRITSIDSDNIIPIEEPIFELSKAPSTPDFWKNYNRIVK